MNIRNYKILIQRADRLGDVILTLPVLEALKKKYPSSQIDYLTSPVGEQLLSLHSQVNNIYIVEWEKGRRIKNEDELLQHIKAQQYDLYISLWNHPKMAAIGKKAGIKVRVGDKSDFFKKYNYTNPITQNWKDYTRHQIEFNLDLLAPLKIKSELIGAKIPINKNNVNEMKAEFKKFLSPDKKYIFILCSTGGSNFPIPSGIVKEFIEKCLASDQFEIILGGHTDAEVFSQFKNKSVLNLINKTSISQLIAAIHLCHYFIGPDSGPTHLASFMDKPLLFFSSMKTNPPCRWGPLSSCFNILRKEYNIPTKKIITCDPKLSFKFLDKELMYDSFMNLVYSHSSGNKMNRKEVKDTLLLNSFRVLYLAKDRRDYDNALLERDKLLENGLRIFVYHINTYSPIILIKLFKLMNRHNINVIQGIIPSWLKVILREYMGVWNQYIKPVFLPVTLFPESNYKDLLEVYQKLYSQNMSTLEF